MGRFGHIRNGRVTNTKPDPDSSFSSYEPQFSSSESFEEQKSEESESVCSESDEKFDSGEEEEFQYIPTQLDEEIGKIMKATLLQEKIETQVLRRVKQLLLCEMENVIRETVKRSILKNPKTIAIKPEEILQVVEGMGEIYRTKVAKTLIYMKEFQKLKGKNEVHEDDTKELSEKPKEIKPKKKMSRKSKKEKQEMIYLDSSEQQGKKVYDIFESD